MGAAGGDEADDAKGGRLHGEEPVRTGRFHTLADVIPTRDEVKREAQIRTVERRTSAYVLAGPSSSASAALRSLIVTTSLSR